MVLKSLVENAHWWERATKLPLPSPPGIYLVGNEKVGKVYRGITSSTKDILRRCLSIVVSDSFVDTTIDAILSSGATEKVGDGKIFVLPCDEAYRIRTGEKGTKSLN